MSSQTNRRSGFGLLKKLQNSIRVFPGEVARTIDESRRGVSNRSRSSRKLTTALSANANKTRRTRRGDDRIGSELIVPSSDDTSLASDISEDVSVTAPHDTLHSRSQNCHHSDQELFVSYNYDSKYRETGDEFSRSSFSRALEGSFPTIGATVFYENFQDLETEELNRKKCQISFDDENGRKTPTYEVSNKNSLMGGTKCPPRCYLPCSVGPAAADDIKAAMGRGTRFRCKKSYCRQNTRNTQKDVEEFLRFCEDNNHSFDEDEDK